jgi:hypothetical protein
LLRGLRVVAVDYAVLTGGADGREVDEWDYEYWHEPTMGVQLRSDIDVTFTFTWGSSFGYHCLEAHDRGIGEFLTHVGEPGGPVVVSVGDHVCWQPLLGREITDAELAWMNWVSGDPPVYWLRLDFAPVGPSPSEPESVWLIAGCWERDRFVLASDDVTVAFDRLEAERMQIVQRSDPASLDL